MDYNLALSCTNCVHRKFIIRDGAEVEGCGCDGWDRATSWERRGDAFPIFCWNGKPNPVANCGPFAMKKVIK
jgi:hypothetical protein